MSNLLTGRASANFQEVDEASCLPNEKFTEQEILK
jgi:hypothetical protein